MRLARVLGAVGRTCITAGVLILLFVAYQLWGTGIRTAQAQNRLEDDFEAVLEEAADQPTTTTTTHRGRRSARPPTRSRRSRRPPRARPTARIVIPAIGVDKIVVEGVSLADLKKGPGHYPETPLPGQEGNAAIAGHRTTYGAPFHRLDELEPGDEITVTTVQGEFTYEVTETHIVSPDPGGGARGQGRQPAHAVRLPPEVQRPRAHHRGVAAGRGRGAAPRDRPRSEDAPPPARRSTTSTARAPRRGRPSSSASCAR